MSSFTHVVQNQRLEFILRNIKEGILKGILAHIMKVNGDQNNIEPQGYSLHGQKLNENI